MRPVLWFSVLAPLLLISARSQAQGWEEAQPEPAPPDASPSAPPENAPAPSNPAAPPPPPPAIRVETPAPAPAGPRRGAHVHDGFYLRLGLGGGYLSSKVTYDGAAVPDRTISGGGLSLDLMIGGTPLRGVAVGGGLWLQSAGKPKTTSDSNAVEDYEDLGFSLLGLFVDGFPDPEGGFHVGGALGLAGLNASFKNENFDPTPDRIGEDGGAVAGIGSHVWVGYDGWVSSEWALGGMLRLSGAAMGRTNGDLEQRATASGFSILFTALYH